MARRLGRLCSGWIPFGAGSPWVRFSTSVVNMQPSFRDSLFLGPYDSPETYRPAWLDWFGWQLNDRSQSLQSNIIPSLRPCLKILLPDQPIAQYWFWSARLMSERSTSPESRLRPTVHAVLAIYRVMEHPLGTIVRLFQAHRRIVMEVWAIICTTGGRITARTRRKGSAYSIKYYLLQIFISSANNLDVS